MQIWKFWIFKVRAGSLEVIFRSRGPYLSNHSAHIISAICFKYSKLSQFFVVPFFIHFKGHFQAVFCSLAPARGQIAKWISESCFLGYNYPRDKFLWKSENFEFSRSWRGHLRSFSGHETHIIRSAVATFTDKVVSDFTISPCVERYSAWNKIILINGSLAPPTWKKLQKFVRQNLDN